ncbi:STAS domain-containing protein [Nocardia sp. NBC_00511]|uniref:STAS domain-containing protein n=1 Tax=Nocardia sp. NBC_00511 TaxID=2903591 RepID=UPI002F916535
MDEQDQTALLQVEVVTTGPLPVVTASGEVDIVSAPVLERALRQALRQRPRTVIVDLAGISFLGSVGIGVLAAAGGQCPELLRIVASHPVRRPLELTGAANLFVLCDSLAAAIAQPA